MQPSDSATSRTLEVLVTNDHVHPLRLVIEPWAQEATLPSQAVARAIFEGPDKAILEVVSSADGLIIYGWEGSFVSDESPELILPD